MQSEWINLGAINTIMITRLSGEASADLQLAVGNDSSSFALQTRIRVWDLKFRV